MLVQVFMSKVMFSFTTCIFNIVDAIISTSTKPSLRDHLDLVIMVSFTWCFNLKVSVDLRRT